MPLKKEDAYEPIPVIRQVDQLMVQRNYLQIKQDVQEIIEVEMVRLTSDLALPKLIVKK